MLVEVIWLMPAMRPNCRSRGVATADAMVSGLAPGSDAPTEMTGKSICGKRRHRKLRVGQRARQQQGKGQQRSSDRPRDGWSGDVHNKCIFTTESRNTRKEFNKNRFCALRAPMVKLNPPPPLLDNGNVSWSRDVHNKFIFTAQSQNTRN